MFKKIDLSPVEKRIQELVQKDVLLSRDSLRIFHGRGGTYHDLNDVNIDVFRPVVVITLFTDIGAENVHGLLAIIELVLPCLQCDCIVVQRRYIDKAPFDIVLGNLPKQVYAQRQGMRFLLSFQQQNIGFFLDIEPGRQWLEAECSNKNVLNLFSYTCAFSVVAKAAGAKQVVNMDMSSRALSIGRDNHTINGLHTDNVRFYAYDIFRSWGRIKRHGPYHIVIIDPPSFQKGSFVASKDYQRVVRKMPELIASGGCFLACLNAPEVNLSDFKSMLLADAIGFDLEKVVSASEYFPDVSVEKQLKMLVFRKVN